MDTITKNQTLQSTIEYRLCDIEPISLEQMDSVKLMNRTDTKFCISSHLVPEILDWAGEHYRVLEIKDEKIFPYHTIYYDTPDRLLYRNHINGKMNRHKVRYRRYIASNIGFYEVKFKSNKKRTIKSRIKHDHVPLSENKVKKFIESVTALEAQNLSPALENVFNRITLVNKDLTERVTIDVGLNFFNAKQNCNGSVDGLCIIEIKQDGFSNSSPIIQLMKKLKLRPKRVSKYCLGSALLNPGLKQNSLKQKLLHINKVIKSR